MSGTESVAGTPEAGAETDGSEPGMSKTDGLADHVELGVSPTDEDPDNPAPATSRIDPKMAALLRGNQAAVDDILKFIGPTLPKIDFGAAEAVRRVLANGVPPVRVPGVGAWRNPVVEQLTGAGQPRLADIVTRNSLQLAATRNPFIEQIASATRQWKIDALRVPIPGFQGVFQDISRAIQSIDWDTINSRWFCPNWDPERGLNQYEAFLSLAIEEALPLTWVPNRELTYALLEAEPEQRKPLLVDSSAAILHDCEQQLAEIERLPYLAESCQEVIAAYRAGVHRSAQALAASIFDTLLRQVVPPVKYRYYSIVKKAMPTPDTWDSLNMRQVRAVPTAFAVTSLLEPFDGHDNVPTLLNRHATAHAVHADQYSSANALKALMLVVAMLCEHEYRGWEALLTTKAA